MKNKYMFSKNEKSIFYENIKNFNKLKIVCIGDLILDHYLFGKIERVSPEAPVPILLYESEKYGLGGAGNVAKNISNLGVRVKLVSLTGNDLASNEVNKLFKKIKPIENAKIKIKNFLLPIKTRLINKSSHLLRLDKEEKNFFLTTLQKKQVLHVFKKKITKFNVVVISDYDKGLLDKELIQKIIKISHQYKKLIIADPKKINLSDFKNSDIITPNQKEMTDAAGKKYLNEDNLIKFAQKIIKENNIKNILITRSKKGMLLVTSNSVKKFKALVNDPVDVTGAGDTVTAVLAIMIASGCDINFSAKISNYAAGVVVKKIGAASLTLNELKKYINEK